MKGKPAMQLLSAIPALPVRNMEKSVPFYRDQLGFNVRRHDGGFAIFDRDAVELHIWQTTDESWQTRGVQIPVSGAETFIAGTASCRIEVTGVEALYATIQPHGVVHPHAPLSHKPWGTHEFGVLDPDNNLIIFFERVPQPQL